MVLINYSWLGSQGLFLAEFGGIIWDARDQNFLGLIQGKQNAYQTVSRNF